MDMREVINTGAIIVGGLSVIGMWGYFIVYTSRNPAVPWRETLSEWAGCAGLGLIPLLSSLATSVLTKNPEIPIQLKLIYRELILFCIVTNSASIVIFMSKFNLLQVVMPDVRLIPTGFIFAILAVTLVCAFVYIATSERDFDAFLPMVSCMSFTLPFSVWAERRIGIIARE
jgi:hypothetical protein